MSNSATPTVNSINFEAKRWLMWTIFFPVIVAVAMWIACASLGIKNSFVVNFGTGDVIPIAAMIFLVVAQEFEKVPKTHRASFCQQWCDGFFVLSLLAWGAFALIKIAMLKGADEAVSDTAKIAQNDVSFWVGVCSLLALFIFSILGYIARIDIKQYEISQITPTP